MRVIIMFLMLVAIPFSGLSQIQGDGEVYLSQEKSDPVFNGGDLNKFQEFINQEFDFFKVTKSEKLIFSFTVNESGEVKNIRVLQYTNVAAASEIIRVLQKSPKWEPAKKGGKAISVEIKMPLNFTANSQNRHAESGNLKSLETKPEFVGGKKNFYEFIALNYRTPSVEGLKGKVLLTFVVEVDGSLTDIRVLEDIGYGTGNEAIRVLKKSPKWKPAEQNGTKVRAIYQLPLQIQSR
ncbi:energy transducer TonB [Flavobacterium sp. GT3R68]|uniref:energy transducer TonB n=1 Tax=Flavobacterium sp. GT3R68 TaxID=2594437 RepID=UPI000F87968D|nr:energy transducer TonB [Flavobacterium sp. GT3R68]RTY92520.1 hypothetical protein EKL32_17090 [Flavobacterium sp. GSN2]TRW94146.1 hypothetical protein FNW07_04305 [Flavobacterium sp. GT3R68]